jgi:hypothetical protein
MAPHNRERRQHGHNNPVVVVLPAAAERLSRAEVALLIKQARERFEAMATGQHGWSLYALLLVGVGKVFVAVEGDQRAGGAATIAVFRRPDLRAIRKVNEELFRRVEADLRTMDARGNRN